MTCSMARFLMMLIDEDITIELCNGVELHGTVIGVDSSMRVHLEAVGLILKDRESGMMERLSIKVTNIFNIFLPKTLHLALANSLENFLKSDEGRLIKAKYGGETPRGLEYGIQVYHRRGAGHGCRITELGRTSGVLNHCIPTDSMQVAGHGRIIIKLDQDRRGIRGMYQ